MDKSPNRRLSFALLAALGMVAGCGDSTNGDGSSKINGSVHIIAGKALGVAETVNGGILIDANAAVTTAKTVNGGIRLGAHATADSLTNVNGGITLDDGARVTGGVESVNGSMILRSGADVAGSLENVNGRIEVTAAHVAGGIKTVNGSISITGNSHVQHGILVEKPSSEFIHFGTDEVPRIVIGPGATVEGELRFQRPVQLYVSDRAVIGAVSGATAIPFTGDVPPS
jgi:cytoskeletal protein CcmA (bactofilin family)